MTREQRVVYNKKKSLSQKNFPWVRNHIGERKKREAMNNPVTVMPTMHVHASRYTGTIEFGHLPLRGVRVG